MACLIAGVYGVVVNLLFVSTLFSSRARWFLSRTPCSFTSWCSDAEYILAEPAAIVSSNWQWLADRLRKNAPAG